MFTCWICKYYSMTTVQPPAKISGTILNDLGFCKQNKMPVIHTTQTAAASGNPLARGITASNSD